MMKFLLSVAISLLFATASFAQCTFDPTVTGNLILCPNGTETLSTQTYDSYQWYKKPFGGSPALIPGATADTLVVDYFNDAGYYFSVEVTDEGCTETSPEVLVDGWVFLPPTVMTTGDYTVGPNGETVVCNGDTAYFELMSPYDTNITWFQNGNVIPGATGTILTVLDSGVYHVQGAPSLCPNFLQQLGVTLEVVFINCGTGIDELSSEVSVYPNPASGFIHVISTEELFYSIYGADGRLVKVKQLLKNQVAGISGLAPGSYVLLLENGKGRQSARNFVIR